MKYTDEIKNGKLILRLSGDLIGEENGTPILDVASRAVQENIRVCVIDISNVRYINSSGIGTLITVLTKFRNKGGEVFLMKPSESVQKLLVITKLNAIFQIVQTEGDIVE